MTELLPWAATLPPGWNVVPLKAVAQYEVSNVDKVPEEGEVPVRLCNYVDVYKNEFIHLGLDFMQSTATENEIGRFGLLVGDVVITKDSESWDDIGVPSLVRETASDLVCGYHLAILRSHRERMLGSFLFRCLQARPIRLQWELASTGVTRFGLPRDEIGRLSLPVPPLEQQDAIVSYLDRETARLDKLIAAKNQLLRLLGEKRQTVVAHGVLRGIVANAPLRDSGVPWLGQIPSDWNVERTRWVFQERDERSPTGEEEMLTVSHLTGVTPRSEKDVNMFEAETTEGYKICYPGDLVINTLWAWMGAMGVSPAHGIVSPAYNVYTPNGRIYPPYADALVRIRRFAEEATRYSKGVWSSRLRLYPDGFFEMYIPVPPLDEQRAIVAHVRAETAKLDALRVAAEQTISLLKERRSTLIAAAVTGHIETAGLT